MATLPSASLSHIVMYVFDFEKMKDFYTNVLGFGLSDIGQARGNDICFLTLDPELDHHQLALAAGRKGDVGSTSLNHMAFRVGSLAALRQRHDAVVAAGADDIEPITHHSWLSVYFRDPENNRMEFFVDTPWYVDQPVVEKLDMSLSDDEIMRLNEQQSRAAAGFRPMADWKADAVAGLRERENA